MTDEYHRRAPFETLTYSPDARHGLSASMLGRWRPDFDGLPRGPATRERIEAMQRAADAALERIFTIRKDRTLSPFGVQTGLEDTWDEFCSSVDTQATHWINPFLGRLSADLKKLDPAPALESTDVVNALLDQELRAWARSQPAGLLFAMMTRQPDGRLLAAVLRGPAVLSGFDLDQLKELRRAATRALYGKEVEAIELSAEIAEAVRVSAQVLTVLIGGQTSVSRAEIEQQIRKLSERPADVDVILGQLQAAIEEGDAQAEAHRADVAADVPGVH